MNSNLKKFTKCLLVNISKDLVAYICIGSCGSVPLRLLGAMDLLIDLILYGVNFVGYLSGKVSN